MQTETDSASTQKDDAGGDEKESLGTSSEIEELGACKRRVKASVPADKVREELDRNYKELASTVQLPGFRRGRVPRGLLEARFGEEIDGDVKEALLSGSLAEVVEEKELNVIGSPKFDNIEFHKNEDLRYEVEFEVRPEFELGEYRGLEASRATVAVTDEDVEERLLLLQRKAAELVPVDFKDAGPEDVYVGKYNLARDGAPVKTGVKASFTPSTKVLETFLVEELPERVASWDILSGNPLKLDVVIADNYPDEALRKAKVELEFVLEETKRSKLPDIDDAFAKLAGKESLEELRAEVHKSLEETKQREEDRKVESKILETILAQTSMDLPEGFIDNLSSRKRLEREYQLAQESLPPEEIKEKLVKEDAAGGDELRREMKEFFVLEKIADKEKIFATEEEINERTSLMASMYGIPPASLREELRKTGRFDQLRLSIRHEKVRAFLRKKAQVSEEGKADKSK